MNAYDNFFLPVDDLEQARSYYHEALGLDVKFDFSNAGMIAYKVGQEEPAIILKDRAKFTDARPTIWFVVDDVQAEYAALCGRGVAFLSPPFEIRTGLAAEFEDPFGNRLGITDYSKRR